MRSRNGIVKAARVHRDRDVPTDHRSAALKLVHGEIYALTIQDAEGPLDTILPHEALQVPVLAAGEVQQ
jgi:hypothetical protein